MGSTTTTTEYPVQTQIRYIMQWFHEWSEMQRGDFIPVLAQKFTPSGYINGLVAGLDSLATGEDRPPSLFQCRIKLFKDWSENWNLAEKEQLLTQIKSADSTFASKFEAEIQSTIGVHDEGSASSPTLAAVAVSDFENRPTVEPEVVDSIDIQ